MQHDIIHIQGKAYVLVPLHEYRGMSSSTKPVADDLPTETMDQLLIGAENPIKILRKARGLTQAQLAEIAGLSRPYLAEMETGRKEGSITALKNLATALKVDISTLI